MHEVHNTIQERKSAFHQAFDEWVSFTSLGGILGIRAATVAYTQLYPSLQRDVRENRLERENGVEVEEFENGDQRSERWPEALHKHWLNTNEDGEDRSNKGADVVNKRRDHGAERSGGDDAR